MYRCRRGRGDRIGDLAIGISLRCAERVITHGDWHDFARAKLKVFELDGVLFGLLGPVFGSRRCRGQQCGEGDGGK